MKKLFVVVVFGLVFSASSVFADPPAKLNKAKLLSLKDAAASTGVGPTGGRCPNVTDAIDDAISAKPSASGSGARKGADGSLLNGS